MVRLEKVVVSPDGDRWKIEVIDEAGKACYSYSEDTREDAIHEGAQLGALYQLKVEVQK